MSLMTFPNLLYTIRVNYERFVDPLRRQPVRQVVRAAALILQLDSVDPLLRLQRRVVLTYGGFEAERQLRLQPDCLLSSNSWSQNNLVGHCQCIYIRTHARTHTSACTHTITHARTHTHTHARMHARTHAHTHTVVHCVLINEKF